jgi:hypothetical protein
MAKDKEKRPRRPPAKPKPRSAARRSALIRRVAKDPPARLAGVEGWPVVRALASALMWERGVGTLAIARQESEGRIVLAAFLMDTFCLGVKFAFWREGTLADFQVMIDELDKDQKMDPIDPACLVKVVQGAVAYAQSFGFPPHATYHHAAILLNGIDASACTEEFQYGREGKPFYVQGTRESTALAAAISRRVALAGGHFVVYRPETVLDPPTGPEDRMNWFETREDDESSDQQS